MLSTSERRVPTLTGLLPPEALGHIQCHEHIFLRKGPSCRVDPALCMDAPERSLRELRDYAAAGGRTIVDAQPGGFGREARTLQLLSEQSQVNLLAVTGFHKRMFLEENAVIADCSEQELKRLFVQELTERLTMDGTEAEARAAMIKVALEPNGLADADYAPWFSAAASAAAETGAPVMVHVERGADVPGLISYFARRGVPAQRLLLCHMDRTHTDEDRRRALDAGCTLCCDSVHRLKYLSDEEELALLAGLCRAGYDGQLVLSLDTTNRRLRAYCSPDMGLDYILTEFVPMLLAQNIPERSIRKMLSENAAGLLSARAVGK